MEKWDLSRRTGISDAEKWDFLESLTDYECWHSFQLGWDYPALLISHLRPNLLDETLSEIKRQVIIFRADFCKS